MSIKSYPEYKTSGIEWLGELPKSWKVKRLKYVFKNLDSKRIPLSGEERSVMAKTYPYYGASGIIDAVEDYIFSEDLLLVAEDGANLLSRSTPLAFIAKGKYWVNNHAHILKPFCGSLIFWEGVLTTYDYTPLISGAAQPKLTAEALANIDLPTPPLAEQQAIASFLDRETSRIDGLLEKKGRQIELLREKRAAMISHAVTRGLDPNVKLKPSNIPWLGDIPKHWEMTPLRYLGRCQNGINIGAQFFGTGFPFVSYGDVFNNIELPCNVIGLVQSSKNDRIQYSVITGDVFFTRTSETVEDIASACVCFQTISDAAFAGFLIRFRPHSLRLNICFSKYLFQNVSLRAFFVKEMNLVTRASLSQDLLKRLPVLLPPESEQQAIAKYLDKQTERIDSIIAKVESSIKKLTEYRTALISAAVTGKIDVRKVA